MVVQKPMSCATTRFARGRIAETPIRPSSVEKAQKHGEIPQEKKRKEEWCEPKPAQPYPKCPVQAATL